MTPNQIVKAYKAVQELSSTVFPYRTTREVTALKKRLAEESDIIANMEKNLVAKYGGVTEADGSIHFKDTGTTKEFVENYRSFMEQDDEVKLPAVDLSNYVDMIRISPGAMEALDDIVIFEKAGKQ